MGIHRRKRFASCLSILVILFLAGCQGGGAAVKTAAMGTPSPAPSATRLADSTATALPTSTSETPAALQVRAADLKGKTILFWHPLAGQAAVTLGQMVQEFNLTNTWGIRVNIGASGSSGALASAIELAKTDGLPDVVLAPSESLSYWQVKKKLIADLNPYIQLSEWGFQAGEQADYDATFWAQDSLGSEQLGIPALRTATGLAYNLTFAADLGYPSAPATTAQFQEQACAAATKNNRDANRYGTGGWMLDTGSTTALSWLSTFGAAMIPTAADGAWNFNQGKATDALRYLRGLQSKGCLWAPKNPTPTIYFAGRNALFITATLQDLVSLAAFMDKMGSKDQWTMIPFPGSDGKPVLYADGYSYGVVNSNPASQMAGWLFARWMSQAKNQARLGSDWVSFPVSAGMAKAMAAQTAFPWPLVHTLARAARPAPAVPSWTLVRRPLEDAFWQVFNLPSDDQLLQVLPQLDQMAADLSSQLK